MALKLTGKDGFYGWVNLAVMFFFNVALMPMLLAFTFFLNSWVKEFGWSRGSATGAQWLSVVLSGLAAPLVAIFIMKHGTKRAIILGNIMAVGGMVLVAYQNHLWQLYLGAGVLVGLGISIGGMLAMMTVINNWFVMKRTIALSISMASMGFSGVIMNPSIMALIEAVGWRNAYLILAVLGLIFCVIVPGLLIKNKPEDLGQVPDGPVSSKPGMAQAGIARYRNLYKTPVDFTAKEALRTRTLWLLVVYGALQFLVMIGAGAIIIDFQFDIGISGRMAGLIQGVFSAVMGISQLGIGFLGLRYKMHSLAVASMAVCLTAFIVLVFAQSLPVPMMLAYSVFFGIGCGVQSIAMGNLFPDYFGRSQFPKIMGYTMPFNTFISSLGAPIAGFIRDTTGSYVPAFRLFLFLLVICLFCILFAKPPVHPSLKGKAKQEDLEPAAV